MEGFNKSQKGTIPTENYWKFDKTEYDNSPDDETYVKQEGNGRYKFYRNGKYIGSSSDNEEIDGNKRYKAGDLRDSYAGVLKYYALQIYVRAKRPKEGKQYKIEQQPAEEERVFALTLETWNNDTVARWKVSSPGQNYKDGEEVTIPVINTRARVKTTNDKFFEENTVPLTLLRTSTNISPIPAATRTAQSIRLSSSMSRSLRANPITRTWP